MNTISLKVPESLAADIAEMAQRKGVSKSALIRDALEAYLQANGVERAEPALSQVTDLVGILSGPEDLSTSPLDVPSVNANISAQEIVAVVRRERGRIRGLKRRT